MEILPRLQLGGRESLAGWGYHENAASVWRDVVPDDPTTAPFMPLLV